MAEVGEAGLVFDIQRFSIHDGPGIRTTVFLKGCPLACPWCHNPESQSSSLELMLWPGRCIACESCLAACPHGAITLVEDEGERRIVTDLGRCRLCASCVEACYAGAREIVGRRMTVGEVLAEVVRDVAFYDQSGGGVTFSGGEPLAQPEFLSALLQACRAREIHTTVDTCGYAPWRVVDAVRRYVDLFLYDLKLMDDARHRQITGVSNEPILDNLRRLAAGGQRLRVRVPVIPGLNDDEANLQALGATVADLPGGVGIDLLAYHPTARDKYQRLHRAYPLEPLQPPTEDQMAAVAARLRAFGNEVQIGG
jgi:pyruvate formate lyase activating enzyme